MLTLLLMIALTNFEIISGVDNDSTFINSLPEKQKKEFLQKVEKRIQNEVPEVQPPEGNDTNVDLYEKRLEDQSKTIQNILRSEIDNLKSSQRRHANNTVRQAHIDLTLRSQNEETDARRENAEHTNKNVLLDKIPVAVQYESENVINEKSNPKNNNESKSDLITWVNTSHIMKTVDISNTSAERKRTGRRSNDFDIDNVTLTNTDISAATDAVDDTTAVNINTKSQEVETTKDAVDFSVSSESPVTQDVASDTTRQEVSTQADDENGKTAQGNNNTITDALYSKKLDYVTSTQNNANISSTTDSTKFNDKDSSLISENIDANADNLVNYTAEYYDKPQTGNAFTTTTQYYVNPQIHNGHISTSLYNFDYSTVLVNVMVTTDATNRNKAVMNTNVTVDIVDSTILNNVTTVLDNVHSSTNKSTEADFEIKNNLPVNTKIHNVITELDNEHNNPSITEPGIVDGVTYKGYHETTQDNDTILNQSGATEVLDDQLHGPSLYNGTAIRNILRSNSNVNVDKRKHNNTADNINTHTILSTTLGFSNTHHFISVGSKNIVYAEAYSGYENSTVVNIIKTTDSLKGSIDIGNVKSNKTTIPNWLAPATESVSKTTRNITEDAPIHNKHKNSKANRELKVTWSQTSPKDTDKNSRNSVLSLHDLNNVTSNDERQPKYVPIYNYDPENAYFHPTTRRPSDDNVIVKLDSSNPIVIKKTETLSKTTKLDIYENGNKKSLRIKDIKQRLTSASNTNIRPNSDLYDIISGNDSVESSNDDVIYEKPLKHSLKKIREKLYKHQINNNPKDNEPDSNIKQGEVVNQYKNEVRKKYGANKDKYEGNSISKLFSKFGTLLENLVDQENNNEISSSESKRESDEDLRSDRELYRDVAISLENHNRAIKSKGIQQIVETLEKIQNKLHKERHHGTHDKHNKGHQSRFKVKNRDVKQKDEDQIANFLDYIDKPHTTNEDEFEHEDVIENTKGIKTNDDYLEIHANIVKDLVDANDEGLQTYDWLGTTVLIQAGLAKIQDVAERKIRHKKLHPLDEKLLEFFMKLHESAIKLVAEQVNEKLPTERKLSFRIPKFKRGKYFNALNRMYGEMKKTKIISLIRSRYAVEDFRDFLMSLRTSLNNLHTAIRQISLITTYKKQRWFKNIKELYLNSAGKKEYLEVLLHFVSARLVGLIDERAKKVVREEEDLTKRDIEADRIVVEFVMAVKICNELTR